MLCVEAVSLCNDSVGTPIRDRAAENIDLALDREIDTSAIFDQKAETLFSKSSAYTGSCVCLTSLVCLCFPGRVSILIQF